MDDCKIVYYRIPTKRHGIQFRGRRSVCLSVCQKITFDNLDPGSSFSLIRYVSSEYGSSWYMKIIRSRARSQDQKGRKSLFPQCKTLIGNNRVSIKHRPFKFACSMGFSDMADWVVSPPSLSHDRKWLRVTTYTHSRVVGLRLEGILVSEWSAVTFPFRHDSSVNDPQLSLQFQQLFVPISATQ